MEANGEGVQEGGLSPPQLLTKGTLYSLSDNPKVTGLYHGPTLPLPFPGEARGPAPALEPGGLRPGVELLDSLGLFCFVFSFDSLSQSHSCLLFHCFTLSEPRKGNPKGISRQLIQPLDCSTSLRENFAVWKLP